MMYHWFLLLAFITVACSYPDPHFGSKCRQLCGQRYPYKRCKPGQKRVISKIRYGRRCWCTVSKCRGTSTYSRFGRKCRQLCRQRYSYERCKPGQKIVISKIRYGRRCWCTVRKCGGTLRCYFKRRYYQISETFQKGCRKCTCGRNGKIKCTSVCAKPSRKCNQFEKVKYVRYLYSKRPRCYCRTYKCVPKTCKYKGKSIPLGLSFVTKDCKKRCWCCADRTVICSKLCPSTPDPNCTSHSYYTVRTHYMNKSHDTHCRCVIPKKCSKK